MALMAFSKTDSIVQFLTVLLIFIFVVAVTYLTVRWMSRIQQGQTKCSNIDIIETKRIANNKYLQVIRAGDKYLLISIGKDEVNLISEIDGNELVLPQVPDSNVSFASILDKFKNLNKKDED